MAWTQILDTSALHFDPGLQDTNLGQGHSTPLGHAQLCEILSTSNMAVKTYGPDMDFEYEYVRDMTLGQVMTHPWIIDNSCVKYYPDRKRG